MQDISVGHEVKWKWGRGEAEGKVTEKFTEDVERKIKGKTVKRKGDKEEPVFLIEQESGGRVLKSQSELGKSHG